MDCIIVLSSFLRNGLVKRSKVENADGNDGVSHLKAHYAKLVGCTLCSDPSDYVAFKGANVAKLTQPGTRDPGKLRLEHP